MTWTQPPGDRRLLRFLGTGTSSGVPVIGCDCKVCQSEDPRNRRTRPSVTVESPAGRILIDCGPDLRDQFVRERIPYADVLLMTHHHADHVFGLDDVRMFPRHLGGPLPVFCEPATEEFIRKTFAYAFDPVVQAYPAGGVPKLEFHRIERPSVRILDHQVVPIPLKHGRYDVLGFRFDSLAYCTDVNHIPNSSMALLRDLDVLVLDALRFEKHATHFSIEEALGVVETLRPKRAYFTHISCQMDPERAAAVLPANVSLAYDGLCVEF